MGARVYVIAEESKLGMEVGAEAELGQSGGSGVMSAKSTGVEAGACAVK